MKVKMKNNLITRYQLCPEFRYTKEKGNEGTENELLAVKRYCGWQEYIGIKMFLKSIEGSVVELVFTCGDAFEKNDNNVWLPNSLWDAVEQFEDFSQRFDDGLEILSVVETGND